MLKNEAMLSEDLHRVTQKRAKAKAVPSATLSNTTLLFSCQPLPPHYCNHLTYIGSEIFTEVGEELSIMFIKHPQSACYKTNVFF